MPTINKNYIADTFKLPGANTLVVLDGVYQPQLSDQANLIVNNQTLKIPQNTKTENPIHLLFLTSQNCHSVFNIVAEENSYTTIIEEHASVEGDPYISNVEININSGTGSEIVHYKLQFENVHQSTCQIKTIINQSSKSKIISSFISKGAKVAKDMLYVKFAGDGASYDIKGISMPCGHQNMTHQIRIEHLGENCTSNVLSKGIVDDQAVSDFDCRVIVHPGAVKTETHVTNRNLLLSQSATANTSPELEVYVDEVICTHGATVGQLDQNALFYLRSRGIEKDMAIKMLTSAFVQEIVEEFSIYNRFKNT
ncbi:MAG: SufD family Fe-S cluster assembly protein, partial [Gammaproteobacteria bacterium]|nr:SufD family Fe-S cluster assembly protein [Gammaproteobacteria bacterium]